MNPDRTTAKQMCEKFWTLPNQSATLANIHHDPATLDEISNALASGREVITHTDPVSVPGYSGAGYIILDPVTGEGAYKIGGGSNGGYLALTIGIVLFILTLIAAFTTIPFSAPFLLSLSLIALAANFIALLDSIDCEAPGPINLYFALGLLPKLLGGSIGAKLFTVIASFIYRDAVKSGTSAACNVNN